MPADTAGAENFSNALLISLLVIVPSYFAHKVGGGILTSVFFSLVTTVPILVVFWIVASTISPRKNEKARYPGRPVEHYLLFHKERDRTTYYGKNKIPMETFHEKYFDGDIDFKGDALEALEYRHDWVNFRFTSSILKFFFTGMLPEAIMHTRSQGLSISLWLPNLI